MTPNGILQCVLYFVAILLVTKPMGIFITKVFRNERTFLTPILGPIERAIYKICRIQSEQEMKWTVYSGAMLMFSVVSMLTLYSIMRLQNMLPFNPAALLGVPVDLAFNTAASFTTNTNWQAYSGESTMSYFTQMAGLAFHNFASAATGLAVAVALVRGLSRSSAQTLGNFWTDLVRGCLYILLPLCVIGTIVFVSQGVIQNLSPYLTVTTVEGAKQVIPMGPVASQEVIKQLGTNGGGFFNANSSHPFENPNALVNFLQMFFIFMIPAALTYFFGRMVKDQKQGWAIFAAMSLLFFAGLFVTYSAEQAGNPMLTKIGVDQQASATQSGGNMEGKEVRFGIANTAIFATATTDASCGAVTGMHDSFTPLGGMMPLFNMMLGEVIFGGVGAGLYGMLIFVILAVFIAGLMVGRTPEYLGKKIEAREVKLAVLAILCTVFSILGFSGWGSVNAGALTSLNNQGSHGLSEVLYAFTSATANNGSAFAGLNANTMFWNVTLAIAMLVGRFFIIIPMLALAGSMVKKTAVPPSTGTFLTNTPLFTVLLIGVVVIVGGLTFFPALSLGPILEHLLMQSGKVF
jgi:K+-transporting ATPase ATPase A chain